VELAEFQTQIQQQDRPVVVEFWAPWCAPCRTMAPALDMLGERYAEQVTLRKINADEHPHLLRELNVMAIPTMLIYEGGREIQRRVGAQSPQQLGSLFERLAQGERQGEALPAAGMDTVTRMLRLTTGLLLVMLGFWLINWPVLIVGAGVFFWGMYDRCPIWQALVPRIRALLPRRSQ
jgi:thioredoxin 1